VRVTEFIGVQYLRGVAALMVVMYHLAPPLAQAWGIGAFPVAALAGGVDVFFVISGFIIWLSTIKPGLRPWPWWRARLIRIVPLYWVALAATLLTIVANGWPVPGPAELVRAFLFVPALNSQTGEFTPFFVPGWTLNYEFFFYAVLGALLFVPTPGLRLVLIVLLFGLLVVLRGFADPTSPIQFRMTSPLMFEFVAGIGIATLWSRFDPGRWKPLVGAACVVLALLFVIGVSPRLHPSGPRVVYFGVPAALLVAAAVCFEEALRRRVIGPLKALGDSSYSLYLSHTLVLFMPAWLLDRAGVESLIVRLLLSLVFCVGIGWLVYRFVERPLLHRMRARTAASAQGGSLR
jgi:exopolysaccharide production protein ExoZ